MAQRRCIDINADLGEGFPHDEAILDLVTSASVSCGAHAGTRETIERTLKLARTKGVTVGAHPGYADPEHFGRRDLQLSEAEIEALVVSQVQALEEIAAGVGATVRFVKPHGALYNQAQKEPTVARGVLAALAALHLPVLGQPGGELSNQVSHYDVRLVAEGFPDRRYSDDGRLVPRSEPGAVLHSEDEVESQVGRLIASGVETLCIHGDDPRAVENARTVRRVLERLGVAIAGFV